MTSSKNYFKNRMSKQRVTLTLTACLSLNLGLAFLAKGAETVPASVAPPEAQGQAPKRELQVLVVMGAAGDPLYQPRFEKEATLWRDACAKGRAHCHVIGLDAEDANKPDAVQLKGWLEEASAKPPQQALWVVLIGHGTFDGRESKFNLRGPDVSSTDMAGWMKPFQSEVAVIQTASASAPFLKALTGPKRVLISATKSADEVFYTRFGQFFAEAVTGAKEPDLDQDGEVSLLEAFLWSSKQVDRFFETEGRLATEHALLEDNGDGVGSRAEAFDGLHSKPVAVAQGKVAEGVLARQWSLLPGPEEMLLTEEARKRRDELERSVEALRARRAGLAKEAYYAELEKLMLKIARIYGEKGAS
ncbi:MAG: hypothetical protein ACAI34_22660 [Verrucomicrobium sp.]